MRVQPGDATADMVKEAWAEVLGELGGDDDEVRSTAKHYGIDQSTASQVSVDVDQQERDGGIVFLVTVGIPVTIHVLNTLWDDLVRPRLRKKFGVDGGPHVE